MKKIISIMVTVESPDGLTFEQEVEVRKNETPEQAMQKCEKECGRGYLCCGWYPKLTLTYYLVRVKLAGEERNVVKFYTTWKFDKQSAIDVARERHVSDNIIDVQAIEIDEI